MARDLRFPGPNALQLASTIVWGIRGWAWPVGILAFTLAFLSRVLAGGAMPGATHLAPFLIAVLVTATLGGWWPATAVATASFFASWYFFVPPGGDWAIRSPGEVVALALFALAAAAQIVLLEWLSGALRKLEAERTEVRRLREVELAMFHELQHRVANGMQMIASLLSLEAERVATPDDAAVALEDAVARLRLLAQVHRRLHDPSFGGDRLREALADLARRLLDAGGHEAVGVEVEADSRDIGVADATSIAMLVAEAVTNAMKHAFAARGGGHVEIRLRGQADGGFVLTVRDDGPGFAEGAMEGDSGSLGTQVMRSMAAKLGASLAFRNDPRGGAVVEAVAPGPAPG